MRSCRRWLFTSRLIVNPTPTTRRPGSSERRPGRSDDLSDVRMPLVSAAERRERLGELQGLLDRALALERTNAEAHFWKARLFVDLADPGVLPEREDLDAAIREAGEAVRLAPEVLAYREALAMYFVINQQDAAVVELMQAAPGGRHPYHLLLRQLGEIPVPPGAVAVQDTAKNFAATEEMKGRITDYPAFRVRAYVVPLSADEIEAFFRSKWPSFRFSKQSSERVDGGGRMQIHMTSLRWSSGGLEPLSAREVRSIAANSPEIGHMVLVSLAEMRNLPESSLEYTSGIESFDQASRKLFSQLVLVNYRKLDPAPPKPTTSSSPRAGSWRLLPLPGIGNQAVPVDQGPDLVPLLHDLAVDPRVMVVGPELPDLKAAELSQQVPDSPGLPVADDQVAVGRVLAFGPQGNSAGTSG